jgi:Zn-dependent protease with chaperone function
MYTATILGVEVNVLTDIDCFMALWPYDVPFGQAERILGNIICTRILVNEALLNAPERIGNAIVAHELGHIKLGHFDKIVSNFGGIHYQLQNELNADAYAASLGYKRELIEALLALIPLSQNKDDILDRISVLRPLF